jgi:hypothetical protein
MGANDPLAPGIAGPNQPMVPLRTGVTPSNDPLSFGGFTVDTPEPSNLEQFGEGVVQGVTRPLTIFRAPEAQLADQGDTIAHSLGEFAGIGLGFLPFLKGTSLALKGAGLLAEMTPEIATVIEGTLATGLFEGMSGKASDFRDNTVKGLALGAGGEVAFLSLGKLWRATFPKFETRAPSVVDIHPTALAMERQLSPGGTPEQIVESLGQFIKHDDQLQYVAAKTALVYKPGGMAVIPGITNPEEFIPFLKREMPDMSFAFRKGKDGVGEILLADTESRTKFINKMMEQKAKFMGSGDPVLSLDEAMNLVTGKAEWADANADAAKYQFHQHPKYKPLVDERIRLANLMNDYSLPKPERDAYRAQYDAAWAKEQAAGNEYRAAQNRAKYPDIFVEKVGINAGFRGRATPATGRIEIAQGSAKGMGNEYPDVEQFSTLVHEYVHHLSAAVVGADKLTYLDNGLRFNLGEFFNLSRHPATGAVQTIDVPFGDLPHDKLISELQNATRWVVARKSLGEASPNALKAAEGTIKASWGYYGSEGEMLSRLSELMFLNPKAAREVAPTASRMLARVMQRESPKLRMLLTKEEMLNIDDYLNFIWRKEGDKISVFDEVPLRVGQKQQRQFQIEGGFGGMGVKYAGQSWEWGRMVGDKLRIFNPVTRETRIVAQDEVTRPLFPSIVSRNAEVEAKIQKMMNEPLGWVGTTVPYEQAHNTTQGPAAFKRVVVNLKNFERIDVPLGGTRRAVIDWARNNKDKVFREGENFSTVNLFDRVVEGLRKAGKDGMLVNDNGQYSILLANKTAMQEGDVISRAYAKSFGINPDQYLDTSINQVNEVKLSFRNVLESRLRQAGVAERDLPHFINVAEHQYGLNLTKLMDPEIMDVLSSVRSTISKGMPGDYDLETVASRSDFGIDRLPGGAVRVIDPDTKLEMGHFTTEDDAKTYLAASEGPDNIGDLLDSDSPMPTGAFGPTASSAPNTVKFQQQMTPMKFGERLLSSTNLFLSMFTAMENFAKSVEKVGLGPAYTKIFEPAQKAILAVDRAMQDVFHDSLGGKSFGQQIKTIEGMSKTLPRDRQKLVTQNIEYLTKPEIAQGGRPSTA